MIVMMKLLPAVILASSVTAQTFSLEFEVDSIDGLGAGDTFSVAVIGDASVGTHMLGGTFAVSASGASQYIESMQWYRSDWDVFPSDGGYAGNGNYNQVIFGQFVLGCPGCGPHPDSALGLAVGHFEITLADDYSPSDAIYLDLVTLDPFTLEVYDEISGQTYNDSMGGELVLGRLTIPAPSTLGAVGAMGLIASRRRRQ